MLGFRRQQQDIYGSYDSQGNLYMNCTFLENGRQTVTKCVLKDEPPMGPYPLELACYALVGPFGLRVRGCCQLSICFVEPLWTAYGHFGRGLESDQLICVSLIYTHSGLLAS